MKKTLSILLILAMIISCVAMVSFAEGETPEVVGAKWTKSARNWTMSWDIRGNNATRTPFQNIYFPDGTDYITFTFKIVNRTSYNCNLFCLACSWGTNAYTSVTNALSGTVAGLNSKSNACSAGATNTFTLRVPRECFYSNGGGVPWQYYDKSLSEDQYKDYNDLDNRYNSAKGADNTNAKYSTNDCAYRLYYDKSKAPLISYDDVAFRLDFASTTAAGEYIVLQCTGCTSTSDNKTYTTEQQLNDNVKLVNENLAAIFGTSVTTNNMTDYGIETPNTYGNDFEQLYTDSVAKLTPASRYFFAKNITNSTVITQDYKTTNTTFYTPFMGIDFGNDENSVSRSDVRKFQFFIYNNTNYQIEYFRASCGYGEGTGYYTGPAQTGEKTNFATTSALNIPAGEKRVVELSIACLALYRNGADYSADGGNSSSGYMIDGSCIGLRMQFSTAVASPIGVIYIQCVGTDAQDADTEAYEVAQINKNFYNFSAASVDRSKATDAELETLNYTQARDDSMNSFNTYQYDVETSGQDGNNVYSNVRAFNIVKTETDSYYNPYFIQEKENTTGDTVWRKQEYTIYNTSDKGMYIDVYPQYAYGNFYNASDVIRTRRYLPAHTYGTFVIGYQITADNKVVLKKFENDTATYDAIGYYKVMMRIDVSSSALCTTIQSTGGNDYQNFGPNTTIDPYSLVVVPNGEYQLYRSPAYPVAIPTDYTAATTDDYGIVEQLNGSVGKSNLALGNSKYSGGTNMWSTYSGGSIKAYDYYLYNDSQKTYSVRNGVTLLPGGSIDDGNYSFIRFTKGESNKDKNNILRNFSTVLYNVAPTVVNKMISATTYSGTDNQGVSYGGAYKYKYDGGGAGIYKISFYAKLNYTGTEENVSATFTPRLQSKGNSGIYTTRDQTDHDSLVTMTTSWQQFTAYINVTEKIYNEYLAYFNGTDYFGLRLDAVNTVESNEQTNPFIINDEITGYDIDEITVNKVEFDVGTAEEPTVSQSATLKDSISYNITVDDSITDVKYQIGDKKEQTADISQGEISFNNIYPDKLDTKITLKIKQKIGADGSPLTITTEKETSVKDYLVALYNTDGTADNVKTLVKATLNYGGYTQFYAGGEDTITSGTAAALKYTNVPTGVDTFDITSATPTYENVTEAKDKMSMETKSDATVKINSASLMLKENIVVRFTVTNNSTTDYKNLLAKYTLGTTNGTAELIPSGTANKYYIEVPVNADKYDEKISMYVVDNTDEHNQVILSSTVNYGVKSYAYSKLKGGTESNENNLIKYLLHYGDCAKAVSPNP